MATLVEWDGDWMNTWEPQEVLGNAQVAINEFLRNGSAGNAARRLRRAAQDDEYAPWYLITPWKLAKFRNFESVFIE